ncbi:unnamed protein product [Vicia faba]|uniref:Uncharacterized protein n=1 Tax=Vicia faba TaxID=3906 RepID=A0AAV1A2L6_VICFA|nr:unnamed protein product [Vicia faba]
MRQEEANQLLKESTESKKMKMFMKPSSKKHLADSIYSSYPTFVKSIRLPQSEPDKLFVKYQEGCQKDIERAFGVLQVGFKIIRELARFWDIVDLALIMRSCIIFQNMIDEVLPAFVNHVRARYVMRDSNVHHELQADLVKYKWTKFIMFHD